MVVEEKNTVKTVVHTAQNQHVFIITSVSDFNSSNFAKEMQEVQDEVKSVMEGAVVDSSKLSLNFTV